MHEGWRSKPYAGIRIDGAARTSAEEWSGSARFKTQALEEVDAGATGADSMYPFPRTFPYSHEDDVPTLELRRAKRTKPESAYLKNFGLNVTSQYGEDGIIAKILDLIGRVQPWCVEFGAWDGKYLSNTWDLITNKGWSGVLLEGDRARYEALADTHKTRAGEVFVEHAIVGWEGDNSLDRLLARTPIHGTSTSSQSTSMATTGTFGGVLQITNPVWL